MKKKNIIIALLIISLIVTLSLYFYYENTKLQVSNYNIIDNKIPKNFNNYKIIQISDFHNTKNKTLKNSLINEIKKQKPNIIVLTGDIIDSNKTNIDIVDNFIKEIKHIAQVYFVTGNHEARIDNYLELKEKLLESNVIILQNELEKLNINDSEINLIGIDDPKMTHESFVSDSEIVKTNLKNIKYDKENYTILLSHRPELFGTYVNENIDLIFTGHAHGGGIRLPFIGGIIAPNQGLFPKYTQGIIKENKKTMIISRGIGNSILPIRINNRPELVVVTLNNE